MRTEIAMTWECGVCKLPIADREGFVHVLDYEADRAGAAIREWELAHPDGAWIGEILTMPQPISWRTSHTLCVPENEWGYTWEIHRLRTLFGLMDFHFHVADKKWVTKGTRLNAFTRAALDRFRVSMGGGLPAPRLPEER